MKRRLRELWMVVWIVKADLVLMLAFLFSVVVLIKWALR